MNETVSGREALASLRRNTHSSWNRSPDSGTRGLDPQDAANRIFDGFADIRADHAEPSLPLDAPVFTMGACFAREIERALVERGGNVVSLDDTIRRDAFRDAAGHVRSGFFHRYTPASMAPEFRRTPGPMVQPIMQHFIDTVFAAARAKAARAQ